MSAAEAGGRSESADQTCQKSWRYIKERNSAGDRLNAAALYDGIRAYSYRQMFRRWEGYAEAFSALGITGDHHARVGLTGVPAAETVFAFYGLNMTGSSVSMIHAVDLYDPGNFKNIVEKEGITDLLLADYMVNPALVRRICNQKPQLGLRHILILPVTLPPAYVSLDLIKQSLQNREELRKMKGIRFMDRLLEEYEASPICYGNGRSDEAAVLLHTSGTSNGIHKPVPLSDHGLNGAAAGLLADERFAPLMGKAVSALTMDLSSVYAMVDILHLTLVSGGKIILLPRIRGSLSFLRAVKEEGVNVLFASAALMEGLIRKGVTPDLSRLAFVFLGGSYVSREAKKRYDAFLSQCGAGIRTTIGYGLSETGGACILADADREDDAMGYPIAGVSVRLLDQESGQAYRLDEGPRRGVLFISSPSVSPGRIDDRVFFELTEMEGAPYLNTYDMAEVQEDGSLAYAGRMDRFFVNNQGIRFDAGLVETAVAAEAGITACAIAPGYDKSIHDTIPVLYLELNRTHSEPDQVIKKALVHIFVEKDQIKETNLPGQCVLMDQIPFNETGKVDIRRILKEGSPSMVWRIVPIREGGRLLDVSLLPPIDAPGRRAGIPAELEEEFKKRTLRLPTMDQNR